MGNEDQGQAPPKRRRGRPPLSDRPDAAYMRERILREAGVLLRTQGPAATTIADIARCAGVTAPAVYWHFDSKDALVHALLSDAWDDFSTTVKQALPTAGTPVERLYAIAVAHTRWQLVNAETTADTAFAQLIEALPAELGQELRTRMRRYVSLVASIVTEGKESGLFEFEDLRMTARAVINVCEYAPTSGHHGADFDESLPLVNARLVLQMLRVDPEVVARLVPPTFGDASPS